MPEQQPETVGYFAVSYPINRQYQKKTWWMRIGSATLRSNGNVIGRIEAMPLNWDGSFHLFPTDKEEADDAR